MTKGQIAQLCSRRLSDVAFRINQAIEVDPRLETDHRTNSPSETEIPVADPARGRWQQSLDDYERFLAAERRAPSTSANSHAEQRLGAWIREQRHALASGLLPEEDTRALDAIGVWRVSPTQQAKDAQWHRNLQAAIDLLSSTGTWPILKYASTQAEHTVGTWLHSQRQNYRRGVLRADRLDLLNTYLPGWCARNRRTTPFVGAASPPAAKTPPVSGADSYYAPALQDSPERAREIKRLSIRLSLEQSQTTETARLWDPHPDDLHPEWSLLYLLGHNSAEIAGYLNARYEAVLHHLRGPVRALYKDIESRHRRDRPSSRHEADLRAFVQLHQRVPTSSDSKRLRLWLNSLLRAEQVGRLDSKLAARLDELGDWRQTQRSQATKLRWEDRLEQLAKFWTEHEDYPRGNGQDKAEATLAGWLNQRRSDKRAGNLDDGQIFRLDEAIPGWDKPRPRELRRPKTRRSPSRWR
ncbi:helicase associated domain-containing protein [Psychromicrobium xiongbiense]|uniref:helicase associated domain-containing protein n=1 Tax=Psychromicrobium xiongbiense TaxID=3051184 RepID=UPI003B211802